MRIIENDCRSSHWCHGLHTIFSCWLNWYNSYIWYCHLILIEEMFSGFKILVALIFDSLVFIYHMASSQWAWAMFYQISGKIFTWLPQKQLIFTWMLDIYLWQFKISIGTIWGIFICAIPMIDCLWNHFVLGKKINTNWYYPVLFMNLDPVCYCA